MNDYEKQIQDQLNEDMRKQKERFAELEKQNLTYDQIMDLENKRIDKERSTLSHEQKVERQGKAGFKLTIRDASYRGGVCDEKLIVDAITRHTDSQKKYKQMLEREDIKKSTSGMDTLIKDTIKANDITINLLKDHLEKCKK